MGTMNVYLGGAAKLAAALAADGVLPAWLAGGGRSVPRRSLATIAVIAGAVLLGLLAGISTTTDLVRATSALFIAVYVLAIVSAIRILAGHARLAAIVSLGGILGLAACSTDFLAVPLVAAAIALALRRALRPHPQPITNKETRSTVGASRPPSRRCTHARTTRGSARGRVVTDHPGRPEPGGMNQSTTQPGRYRIVVRGRVGSRLADSFAHLEVESRAGESTLAGTFVDQAQLHGLLDRLRDLGIPLISVNPETDESASAGQRRNR
jgi:hypothetical protein